MIANRDCDDFYIFLAIIQKIYTAPGWRGIQWSCFWNSSPFQCFPPSSPTSPPPSCFSSPPSSQGLAPSTHPFSRLRLTNKNLLDIYNKDTVWVSFIVIFMRILVAHQRLSVMVPIQIYEVDLKFFRIYIEIKFSMKKIYENSS